MDGKPITIKAGIETIGNYCSLAGHRALFNFIKRIWRKLKEIRIVHGDHDAKNSLKNTLK